MSIPDFFTASYSFTTKSTWKYSLFLYASSKHYDSNNNENVNAENIHRKNDLSSFISFSSINFASSLLSARLAYATMQMVCPARGSHVPWLAGVEDENDVLVNVRAITFRARSHWTNNSQPSPNEGVTKRTRRRLKDCESFIRGLNML